MLALLKTKVSSLQAKEIFFFGPFNSHISRRWKKPIDSAQTRLENRTLDPKFDKLMIQQRKLKIILKLHEMMSRRRDRHVFVEMLSRLRNIVGLNIRVSAFLHKFPHIFEVYDHPPKRSPCCRLTQKMLDLIEEETRVMVESELDAVKRLKKLLMISKSRTLHVHALWLIRRELGLPDDFRDTILRKHPEDFDLVSPEMVALVTRDEALAEAAVEKWREKEYKEKWLSGFETKYAFPIEFPTGFKMEKGFREKLRNWQRVQYLKPYDKAEVVRVRTCSGGERFEKRAVAVIHELLSLTVEKMVPVERLAHFRRDFSMEANVREVVLKHPGIFYVSTRDGVLTVFLREAYSKGWLVEPNPIYTVRRKMLELVALGCRNSRKSLPLEEVGNKVEVVDSNSEDWVIPMLISCKKN